MVISPIIFESDIMTTYREYVSWNMFFALFIGTQHFYMETYLLYPVEGICFMELASGKLT